MTELWFAEIGAAGWSLVALVAFSALWLFWNLPFRRVFHAIRRFEASYSTPATARSAGAAASYLLAHPGEASADAAAGADGGGAT